MKTTMVRYKTHAAQAEANAALIRAVYDELRLQKPEGLRYVTYRHPDGVTFVHFSIFTGDGENPLPSLPVFRAFVKDIKQRCEEPPAQLELKALDSYGWQEPV